MTPTDTQTLKTQVKDAIVRSLRLTIQPGDIDDEAPLFGDGLGLDSIDALELVLELDRTFGVAVTDEEMGTRVLKSVSSIVAFIEAAKKGC
jgi:acyl carrier protein